MVLRLGAAAFLLLSTLLSTAADAARAGVDLDAEIEAIAQCAQGEDREVVLLVRDKELKTRKRVACFMTLLREMLAEEDEDAKEYSFPLMNVDAATMTKVLEFGEMKARNMTGSTPEELAQQVHIAKLPRPLIVNVAEMDELPEAERRFITAQEPIDDLYDLTLAANYLHFQALLDLCEAQIASIIRHKTLEEIRRALTRTRAAPETATSVNA